MSDDRETGAVLVGKVNDEEFKTLMQALKRGEKALHQLMGAKRGEIVAYRLTMLVTTRPEIGQMTGGSVTNTVDASPDVVQSLLYVLDREEQGNRARRQEPAPAGKPN